ncbi:MAG TPA: lipopolysaccharide kinase InaA family protein [Polyangiaceae bacterium]|nr:lipopolysaccharide kinase InaA family protein [Polyangiaceae bacterium]
MNDEDQLIQVSPRHSVLVGPEYAVFIKKAPRQDFVVRTIMKREANGMPLVSADIVIAGEETRASFPLAASYPLHFRKTYYPGRLHGDPRQERDRQNEASEILGIPPAIGATHQVFRSCFLPGSPYNRLSPFGAEPEEANLPLAKKLNVATAAGLWRLLEDAFDAVTRLHAANIAHGDLELHNLIVCASPLECILIDFEATVRKEELDAAVFEKRCAGDFLPMLKEAILLQCALGAQVGPLADLARQRVKELFKRPERFLAEIGEQAKIA